MPSFFGVPTGRSSCASLFEIRLDNEFIVLRGSESEASSQLLKGSVILCLPQATKVESVHLRMTGQLKVGWSDPAIPGNSKVEKSSEIFCHRWTPFVGNRAGSNSKGATLSSGNYEWPFELIIPGSMSESVEGLTESHITYKLKATVARGKFAHDLHSYKPVRIVRTLDPSALELAHAMTVENVWPNKVEYQIVIPQKAVIFGTAIAVEMRFTPLLKGLVIGKVKAQLFELHELTTPGTVAYSEKMFKLQRDIKQWELEISEDNYQDMINEDGQDGYTLKTKMELPKSLSLCVQDVDVHGIKIRHKIKFHIALHNPDGHVSELRATLPVTIFISPNMPLTANGQLVDQTPMSTQSADLDQHAPPLYGQHQLDQLYAGMSISGIITPAPQSGMSTPFQGLSRAGSQENLTSLDGVANMNGAVPPAALSSRLQNLDSRPRHLDLSAASRNNSFWRLHGSGSNSPLPIAQRYPDYDPENSNGPSRRTSADENSRRTGIISGQRTPDEHIDFANLGDLSKVPSYQTAVRTPVRGMINSDALPDYNAAVSAPPSPTRAFAVPASPTRTFVSPASPRESRRQPMSPLTSIVPN